jgi:hypothetical protein
MPASDPKTGTLTIAFAYRTKIVMKQDATLLTSILNYSLIAIFVAAFIGCAWANFQMFQRARAFGGRFWAFNPLAMFAGMTMRHTAIFFACWIVGAAAVVSLIVLNHGLDELKNALSGIRAGPPKH